jgi:hypothetical protein
MWGALSDKRWFCSLQLLLILASAVILGSELRGAHDRVYYFRFFKVPQPGGLCLRIYIPRDQGNPVLSLGTGFPFGRPLRFAGLL